MFYKTLYFLGSLLITGYLLSSQKSEMLHLQIHTTDLNNQSTCAQNQTVKICPHFDTKSEKYIYFNTSYCSIFSFKQKKPITMERGYFLDFEEKNFFPQKAFTAENCGHFKLYLFPFDANQQTTIYTEKSIIKCTLKNSMLDINLKNQREDHSHYTIDRNVSINKSNQTTDGYLSFTSTCVTICTVDDSEKKRLETIDHNKDIDGFILDQKNNFLPSTFFTQAQNDCFIRDCPQENTPHFHFNFPSLLIIPFDKNGKASFVNHLNHEVRLELIDANQSKTNQNVSHESVNQIINFQIPIDTVEQTISHSIPNPIIKDNNKNAPDRETNSKTESKSSHEKNKTTPKSSFFSLFKIASFSFLTLFLITAIIKSHIFFTFK